ncbi:hypothetical protein [Eisenbergiella sp.]
MAQGYLEQESSNANRSYRKTIFRLTAVFFILIAFIYFLGRDSFDLNDPSGQKVLFILKIIIGIMLLAIAVGLFKTRRTAANGENLILPFGEDTKEAVAKKINQEAAEGKLQVEEYIDVFAEGKTPHGEKVTLTPSYLLLCGDRNKITVIPRNKIYWICAQVGQKGGPFYVRLLIFTENKMYALTGVDIEHVEKIAEKLYQYIPNVFCDYDPFLLSYELEKVFAKDRAEFVKLYEMEKAKHVTM